MVGKGTLLMMRPVVILLGLWIAPAVVVIVVRVVMAIRRRVIARRERIAARPGFPIDVSPNNPSAN